MLEIVSICINLVIAKLLLLLNSQICKKKMIASIFQRIL